MKDSDIEDAVDMMGDSLDEADDEDFGEGPDAADLKEAEEDLAEFDDN